MLDGRCGPLASAWLRHSAAVGCRLAARVVVDSDEARHLLERRFGRTCELLSYGADLITSVNPSLLASIAAWIRPIFTSLYSIALGLLKPRLWRRR